MAEIFGLILYYFGSRGRLESHRGVLAILVLVNLIISHLIIDPVVFEGGGLAFLTGLFLLVPVIVFLVGLIVLLRFLKSRNSIELYRQKRKNIFRFLARLGGSYLVVIGVVKSIITWITGDPGIAWAFARIYGSFAFILIVIFYWISNWRIQK